MRLAFDFGDEDPDWSPLYTPFQPNILGWIARRGCRDCGGDRCVTSGSRHEVGTFELCGGCEQLVSCGTRLHDLGADVHVSYYGTVHTVAEHDELTVARDKRRAAWRKKPGLRLRA